MAWTPPDRRRTVKDNGDRTPATPPTPNQHAPVEDAPIKRLALVRAADVVMESVGFLWTDRIPVGKVAVIDGMMGVGKTTLICAIGAAVTHGGSLPGQLTTPRASVILISLEDDAADTLVPRLTAAGADLTRCHLFTGYEFGGETTAGVFNLAEDCQRLATAIKETGTLFVGIDPFTATLGAAVNSYKDQDVRRVLAPLARVAADTGAAINFTRHFRKGGGAAEDAGGGSVGIGAACRSVLRVDRDPEDADRYLLSSVKQSVAKRPPTLGYRIEGVTLDGAPKGIETSRVVWDGESLWTASDLAAAAMNTDERPRAEEAQDWLRDALTQGPRPARDLFKAAAADGISQRTLQRAADVLHVVRERKGFGEGAVWFLSTFVAVRAKEPSFVPSKTMARMGTNGANGADGSSNDADAEFLW